MRLASSLSVTLCTVVASVALLSPSPTHAWGGTFSEAGPVAPRVEQSGETVLFWLDGTHIEAHIQIQYEGEPEGFAWIVPVPAMPEIQIGSQALFDNVLETTAPAFAVGSRSASECDGFTQVGCGGFIADEGFDSFFFDEDEGGFESSEPEVIDRGFAGVFAYEVLTVDSADEITAWLDQAGYANNPDAAPILADYVQEGFVFVAFRLRGGIGVDEIHPITIRYPGTEPSIPIRLSRVAATDNLPIRALFLAQERVVPGDWAHVELNWAKLDWLDDPAADYRQLVSQAIDDAGGQAFVTEYAGTDAVVSTVGLDDPRWNQAAFEGIEAVDVVTALSGQGLMACDAGSCSYLHPQVAPLLQRYLPVPDDMTAAEFYGCVECFEGLVDMTAWTQPPGFAAEFEQRISGPGRHAVEMLSDAVYLTRLFTRLSPDEMLDDPQFHTSTSLDTVTNSKIATRVESCDDSPSYIELDDGRKIALDFELYPVFSDMPTAERIERVNMDGSSQVELDNRSEIDDIIDAYNRDKYVGPSPWTCSVGRVRPEPVFVMLALFGIAWWQRAPRRRA